MRLVVFAVRITCHHIREECHGGGPRCRAAGITVMDCGPVDNTRVNTACLFPEPCALGVSF